MRAGPRESVCRRAGPPPPSRVAASAKISAPRRRRDPWTIHWPRRRDLVPARTKRRRPRGTFGDVASTRPRNIRAAAAASPRPAPDGASTTRGAAANLSLPPQPAPPPRRVADPFPAADDDPPPLERAASRPRLAIGSPPETKRRRPPSTDWSVTLYAAPPRRGTPCARRSALRFEATLPGGERLQSDAAVPRGPRPGLLASKFAKTFRRDVWGRSAIAETVQPPVSSSSRPSLVVRPARVRSPSEYPRRAPRRRRDLARFPKRDCTSKTP